MGEATIVLAAAEFLAMFCTGMFAGAAVYINLVEHPARMSLETRAAAAQWAPSYERATLMQAPLAIVSFVAGCAAWSLGGGAAWLIAALLIGAVVPFTLIVIKPTNNKLLASGRDLGSADTRALLERWGRLHAVRSLLSVLATLVILWQLLAS
jgi:anthrone oxygenase-like protein